MDFTADSYRSAAREHLLRALRLHEVGDYYLSHYLSGLAVECILRAYAVRRNPEFDARHDLGRLASRARFFELVPPARHLEIGAAINELNLRWRSNHRFADESRLWQYLAGIKADFGQKGERRKNNSRTAYNLAYRILSIGEKKWNSI